jgi:murein L,D-transpeptidase YcbB/YkuD
MHIATPEQLARFDVELTRSFLQFLADLHGGRVQPDFTLFAETLPRGGFDPVERLHAALRTGRLDGAVAAAEPRIALYARVRRTLAEYRQLERTTPQLAPLPEGAAQLRERLVLLGDLAAGAGDAELPEGVRRFQLRHGLPEDGVPGPATTAALAVPLAQRVRQLEFTLERLRWIPPLRPGPLIVVNVPAFRLWAFDTSEPSAAPRLEMRVIVGSAVRTPTPLFIGQLRHLEFNPYWNVPRSIELGEIVPKLARDPDYLRRNDMELVARQGHDPADGASALAALRAGTVRVRQRPGERNVLGAVKFAMPNPMNIYLHSTSARELFNRTRRDLSHGCIRLEKPAELAEFVLRGQTGWDHASVQAAMAPGPTRTVRLAAPIPVILSYATAVTDRSGRALFAADIYGRDRKLARALGLPDAAAAAAGRAK